MIPLRDLRELESKFKNFGYQHYLNVPSLYGIGLLINLSLGLKPKILIALNHHETYVSFHKMEKV